MRIRYCTCWLQKLNPCQNGWAGTNETDYISCFDEPMKDNCKNIVDSDTLACPTCGALLSDSFSQSNCIQINKQKAKG